MTFTGLNDYELSRSCVGDYSKPVCIENNLALDYCAENGFYSLRIKQDQVSKEIMRDLVSVATRGKNQLYWIISACIGIVVLSSFAIVVLLIIVIKDKSHVMAIFAEIKKEEIEKVISHARSLPITSVRFKMKHVEDSKGDEEKYWKAVTKAYKVNKTVKVKEKSGTADKENNKVESPENKKEVVPEENNKPEEDDENGNEQANISAILMQQSEEEKKRNKKALLSQIDTQLRNSSICRLGIVLLSFLAYGTVSLYFNYYMHDFNYTTTDFFYQLSKRNVYGVVLTGMMREGVRLRNKTILLNNPDPNGEMFMQDYLDEMMRVEARVKEYNLIGNRNIFADYFDLTEKLDTPLFCSYVDSYQVGQSGICKEKYQGPQEQGLTAGMAYFLSYHNLYVSKILATDFSDEEAVNAIAIDPGLTFPGSKLLIYLQSGLEQQLIQYRKDAVNFYEKIEVIIGVKAGCFVALFLILYFLILLSLLSTLKSEIWLTHGMLNMIPMFILEANAHVQNQIWQRRRIS